MMQSRTHTCNELRMEHVGQKVKIVGWMENVREVGSNFAFVVVRDFYGITQVVIETEEMMKTVKAINKESTISVEGVVRERASKNPKLPTGDIEVVPEKIEVLGRCRYNELPFEINRSREADEAQRLKYRYLDLRNPAVKKNIILRCNVISPTTASFCATRPLTTPRSPSRSSSSAAFPAQARSSWPARSWTPISTSRATRTPPNRRWACSNKTVQLF